MKLPNEFNIRFRDGIDIYEDGFFDNRLNLMYSFRIFNESEINIINEVLNESNNIVGIDKNNNSAEIIKWKTSFLTLNELNIFYIDSSNTILNFILNSRIIYNKKKVIMLIQSLIYISMLFLPLFFSFILVKDYFFTPTLIMFLCIYISSLYIHEIAHCLVYWFLNKENKSNGYFVITKNYMCFVSKTLSFKKDKIIAFSGSIFGGAFAVIIIIIIKAPLFFWLIYIYQIAQLLPIFPDGKIIFGKEKL